MQNPKRQDHRSSLGCSMGVCFQRRALQMPDYPTRHPTRRASCSRDDLQRHSMLLCHFWGMMLLRLVDRCRTCSACLKQRSSDQLPGDCKRLTACSALLVACRCRKRDMHELPQMYCAYPVCVFCALSAWNGVHPRSLHLLPHLRSWKSFRSHASNPVGDAVRSWLNMFNEIMGSRLCRRASSAQLSDTLYSLTTAVLSA